MQYFFASSLLYLQVKYPEKQQKKTPQWDIEHLGAWSKLVQTLDQMIPQVPANLNYSFILIFWC